MTSYRLLLTGLILMLLPWAGAQADKPKPMVANPWLLCEPDPLAGFVTKDTGAPKGGPIEITADSGESSREESVLKGNVVVKQDTQEIHAPEVIQNRLNNHFTAKQGVDYGSPDMAVRGDLGGLETDEKTGWFENAQYFLPKRNARGNARRIDFQHSDKTTQLQRVTFSTCDRGHEFWQLHMPELNLNQNTGRGEAKHVVLDLGSVPAFYWPYLSFPINDQRQSGFLMPRIGYSTPNGMDISIPYYWNIAPNQDMTLTPRILSARGVMLGTEYRFLLPKSQGQADFEYLPHDSQTDSDRWGLDVRAKANPLPRFYSDLVFQEVSDHDYVNDFSNHLYLLSQSYLERHFENHYYGDSWSLSAQAQSFQILEKQYFTGDLNPYDRLPQLLFTGNWVHPDYGLNYGLTNELVNFTRGQSLQGLRLDAWPAISLPWQRPYGFLTPRLGYRATAYDLRDLGASTNVNPPSNDITLTHSTPSRQAPIFSTDSGLFFERPLEWPWGDNRSAALTLEPRLFYLYVPYRQQNNLPHFDTTALVDRSYSWLFLENRFAGSDRLGDANQLSTGVSSRLLNSTDGSEQASINIGGIWYFQDRKVTLYPTDPVQTDRTSPLITEGTVKLIKNLYLHGYLQQNSKEILRDGVNLSYRFGDGQLVNFAYNFAKNEPEYEESSLEQLDISSLWTFNDNWRAVGRWNYSLMNASTVQFLAGFEYEACCWALRVLAREYRNEPQNPLKSSVFVELELKGLTDLGSSTIPQLLIKAIPGYQPRTIATSGLH